MTPRGFHRRTRLALGLLTAWTLLLSGAPPALSLPKGIQVSSASGAARAKGAPKPTPAQKPMSLAERRKQVREDKSKAAQRTLGGPAGKNEQKPGAAPQAPKPRKQGKASSGIAAAATASIVRAEPDDFRVLGPEGSTRGVSQQWVGTSQWFSGQVFMGETITLSTAMLNSESKYVNGKYVDTPHQVKVTWKVSCGKDTTIDKGQTVTAPSTTYHYNNKTTPVPYVSTQVTLTPELCPNSMPGDSVYATGFTATAIGEVLDDSNPEPGDRTGKVTMRLLFAAPIPDASTDGCLTDCSLTGFAQPQTIRNGTVNTATGAFSLTSTDLTQAKVGGGWTAARHYSSQRAADGSSAAGSMGPGWSLPWESTFQHNKAARNAVFTSPTGSVHTYPYFVGGGGSCCDAPNTSRSDMSRHPCPIHVADLTAPACGRSRSRTRPASSISPAPMPSAPTRWAGPSPAQRHRAPLPPRRTTTGYPHSSRPPFQPGCHTGRKGGLLLLPTRQHTSWACKSGVSGPFRPAQESPRTPHDASWETDRTPAASAACSPPSRSTPGRGPTPPGRRPRRRCGGRPGLPGA